MGRLLKSSVAEPDPEAVNKLLSGAGAVITNYDSSSAMDSVSVSTMLIRIQGFADLRVNSRILNRGSPAFMTFMSATKKKAIAVRN
jgi:hypothetical protein